MHGQTNDEFRYRWNNCKDNNRKSVRDEDHKQSSDFFACFQTAGHSGFINDTDIRFIDKTDPSDPTRREHFWIDPLKTRYTQEGLSNIDPYYYFLFRQFTSFHHIYGICFFLVFWNFIIILEFIIYRLFLFPISPLVRQVIPLKRPFLVPPPPVTCLLVLLFLFIFHLGTVVQEIEILQKAFCCLYYYVTELL